MRDSRHDPIRVEIAAAPASVAPVEDHPEVPVEDGPEAPEDDVPVVPGL